MARELMKVVGDGTLKVPISARYALSDAVQRA